MALATCERREVSPSQRINVVPGPAGVPATSTITFPAAPVVPDFEALDFVTSELTLENVGCRITAAHLNVFLAVETQDVVLGFTALDELTDTMPSIAFFEDEPGCVQVALLAGVELLADVTLDEDDVAGDTAAELWASLPTPVVDEFRRVIASVLGEDSGWRLTSPLDGGDYLTTEFIDLSGDDCE